MSERDGDPPSVPAWRTYIWAENADDTVARVRRAGGSVVMEPFDLLDAAHAAVVSDPAGAEFGVWQPGEYKRAGIVNEPGAWSMSQLNTHDPDGSKAFYGAVYGCVTDTFDSEVDHRRIRSMGTTFGTAICWHRDGRQDKTEIPM